MIEPLASPRARAISTLDRVALAWEPLAPELRAGLAALARCGCRRRLFLVVRAEAGSSSPAAVIVAIVESGMSARRAFSAASLRSVFSRLKVG